MTDRWQQFTMDLDGLDPEIVEAVFVDHGAVSVTLADAGDNPVLEPGPGETPLWTDTRITGLFPADAALDGLSADLKMTLGRDPLPRHRLATLEERDWEREWLKDFGPMQFGRHLWICPGDADAPDDAVVVRLDPGLAFGTGTHPTTALCLEWLDGLDLAGKRVLDYGAGSGILAIAALKLGATGAVAMDIDPQALLACRDNAERNGVAERLSVVGSDEAIDGRFDVVLANILAGPLVELRESLTKRALSGGQMALSGILSGQRKEIETAYADWIAFEEPAERTQDMQTWVRLSGRRRDD